MDDFTKKERVAFERHMKSLYGCYMIFDRDPDAPESYFDAMVAAGWRGWLECAIRAEKRFRRGNGRR